MPIFNTRRPNKATRERQAKQQMERLKEKGAKNMAKAAKKNKPKQQFSWDDLSPELRAAMAAFTPIENDVDKGQDSVKLEFEADDELQSLEVALKSAEI